MVALKQKRIKQKERLAEEIVFMIKGVQNKITKYLLQLHKKIIVLSQKVAKTILSLKIQNNEKKKKIRFHTSPTESKLANSSSLRELWHFCAESRPTKVTVRWNPKAATQDCLSSSRISSSQTCRCASFQCRNKDSLKQQPPTN